MRVRLAKSRSDVGLIRQPDLYPEGDFGHILYCGDRMLAGRREADWVSLVLLEFGGRSEATVSNRRDRVLHLVGFRFGRG
jgi:hypothetical protein